MSAILQTIGGMGLFLFGMGIMTSGLKKLAGNRLQKWLARSTRNPVMGACTGATVTALIQSSSATTVAAIGFVAAGLMSFTSSLGIIFGANIGTTVTGWMVALLGFKLKLGEAALPLIFIAALCYLVKRVRPLRGFGKALAGFCLIFLGIGYLQAGLEGYQGAIDLGNWNTSSWSGRIALVFVGIVLTLVTQSSSATVATALTALNASLIDLPQAAAVIIGADIGTTATAALATIGGTTASRRTGFAHVIYNIMTGVGAFFLLPFYLLLVERCWPGLSGQSPEVVAVSFHTTFNVVGVVVALPFTRPFGWLIERLFRERTPPLLAAFEKGLLHDSHAAVAGLVRGCRLIGYETVSRVDSVLRGQPPPGPAGIADILAAVSGARQFAMGIEGGEDEEHLDSELVFECIHMLDHAERMAERLEERERIATLLTEPELKESGEGFAGLLCGLASVLEADERIADSRDALSEVARELESGASSYRQGLIRKAVARDMSGEELNDLLDARRWLRRVSHHAARIAFHLERMDGERCSIQEKN